MLRVGSVVEPPRVNGFTVLTRGTNLGRNVNFNGFRVYGGGAVSIGDNFHSGAGCKVITQVHNYKGNKIPYDETYIFKDVVIEDNVWFGMNVLVLAKCTIGEGAIIQAGSVVVSDIPPLSIAGGNPAKVFAYRDESHYKVLVAKKAFH
ncbi:transferase hexapeptide (six repeat-containing protein) [Alteromonadaceae bacterium Bs31]|nr:transferase hexapeptide (six repeat-containing protein) [Alteromonadaceae bacterium Bs31]